MFSGITGSCNRLVPSSPFPVIMFCGDSITYANGGSSGNGAYKLPTVNRFLTLYGWTARPGIDIVGSTWNGVCSYPMCGTAGITTAQLNSTYLPVDLPAFSPTHCFIHIGTNDCIAGTATATIIANLSSCLDTIRAALPTCKVTVCKIIDRSGKTTEVDDYNKSMLPMISARSDVSYLSMFDANTALGPYSVANYTDVTHPNDTGYAILGTAIGNFFYSLYPNG